MILEEDISTGHNLLCEQIKLIGAIVFFYVRAKIYIQTDGKVIPKCITLALLSRSEGIYQGENSEPQTIGER